MQSNNNLTNNVTLLFYFKSQKRTRLMTVINGIPFYQSSGDNSNQPNTWLPFKGLDLETEWFIKPNDDDSDDLPEELLEYIHWLGITDNIISIKRFGNLYTMCLSAHIGAGFWKTEQGTLLKKCLQNNYPQFFVENTIINELQRLDTSDGNQQKNICYETIDAREAANKKLNELGSTLPLGNERSRLFNTNETIILLNLPKNAATCTALQQLNVSSSEPMTSKKIKAIVNLISMLHKLNLLEHAAKIYLFESQTQLNNLLIHIKNKDNKITMGDLNSANLIHRLFSDQADISDSFINNDEFRNTCRKLSELNHFTNYHIQLITELFQHSLLDSCITLLNNLNAIDIVNAFYKQNILTPANIDLLNELSKEKMLDKRFACYDISFYQMLSKLISKDALKNNSDSIAFIEYLYNNHLIKETVVFETQPHSLNLIKKLSCQEDMIYAFTYCQSKAVCDLLCHILDNHSLSDSDVKTINNIIQSRDEKLALLALKLAIQESHVDVMNRLVKDFKHLKITLHTPIGLMNLAMEEKNSEPLIEYILMQVNSNEIRDKLVNKLVSSKEPRYKVLAQAVTKNISRTGFFAETKTDNRSPVQNQQNQETRILSPNLGFTINADV